MKTKELKYQKTDDEFERIRVNNNKIALDFNIKALAQLVNVLGTIHDSEDISIKDISFESKKYDIKYSDNTISFTCDDGRSLDCYYDAERKDFCVWNKNVSLGEKDSIILFNSGVHKNNNEKITPFDLGNKLVCFYGSRSPDFAAIIQDINCYKVDDTYITFDEDRISFGEHEVTLDGENLFYNGTVSAPYERLRNCLKIPFKAIDSLPGEKETFIERIKSGKVSHIEELDKIPANCSDDEIEVLINKYRNSLFTIEDNCIFELQSFSRNEMPICRKVIDIRKKLINGFYRRRILSSDEISSLTDIFSNYCNGITDNNGARQKEKKEGLN